MMGRCTTYSLTYPIVSNISDKGLRDYLIVFLDKWP